MRLMSKLIFSENTAKFALGMMKVYKTLLAAKLAGLNLTINKLQKSTFPDNSKKTAIKTTESKTLKEEKDMKGFLKFFAVAALAALAAAVYYMYRKDKHLKNLEDMMYGEHFEDDFYDDAMEDYADVQDEALEESETI